MTKVKQEKNFAVHWVSYKCGKTFAVHTSSVLKVPKKAIERFIGKIFAVRQKSVKTVKLFSCLTFVVYIISPSMYATCTDN